MLNIHLPTLQGTITDYQLVTTEERPDGYHPRV